MKKSVKILSVILALVIVIGCFAACGGDKEETNGIKIGVQTTTTGDIYASGDFGNDAVTRYDNGALAVQDHLNGNIDYVIIDADPAVGIVENFNAIG